MKQRCSNPNHVGYKNWGGRGIKVCKKWEKFENFFNDMAPSYQKGLSLDRIDNNKNYTPRNCKWSTPTEQVRNRRNSAPAELIKQLEVKGLTYNHYKNRLHKGWSEQQAKEIPLGKTRYQYPKII